ncbi:UNVERIFIED_CONTAM: hypothetical protein Slati_3886800 [Sesamum latifolium]|uniref:Retrotransposon gag domain-containing protein n=1 Tax=Sesamum latifolium TaxID=2727402 RepID=A0AAW2TM82_9LAMI
MMSRRYRFLLSVRGGGTQLVASGEARWQREETPHTWINFVKEFNDKFVPQVVRDRREQEFVNLIQGSCTVAQYEAKFNKLIKYAPYMLDDELRRTKKFLRGLRLDIQRSILPCGLTTYTAAVERLWKLRLDLPLSRLEERVKRARSTPPIVQGTRFGKRPMFGKFILKYFGEPKYVSTSDQHMIRDCPMMQENNQQPQTPAQQGVTSKPGGTGNQVGRPKIRARAFALGGEEATNPTTVIEGTICISNTPGRVLFDPGATHSFVGSHFTPYLTVKAEVLPYSFEVSMPMGIVK